MNLSDNEKRDIIKYLEKNKSLPEKYRFLLFDDAREVELLWNGKTNEVCNLVLPFQTIEQIDEPRSEGKIELQQSLFDTSGRQIQGWTNKLIWGDNKLILSSLKNGPLRKEIEKQGGLKLIYIDPPFDVGADFSMNVQIGEEEFTKKPSVIEEIAFRDTWGRGMDSFVAMIYERLRIMHELLADNGSIYIHCDWRVNSSIRLVLDEIFGKGNYRSEIIWNKLTSAKAQSKYFSNVKDSIFHYTKSENSLFNAQFIESSKDDKNYSNVEEITGRRYGSFDFTQKGSGSAKIFGDKVLTPPAGKHWIWSQEKINQGIRENRIIFTKNGVPRVKRYLDEKEGNYVGDLWSDEGVAPLSANASERYDYPTQKPESLLERIIKASSNEGDLVADFFCGSGTTLAVAEKLGRKWIGSDLGRFSIHTARKRMISVQRELKKASKDFRAFEILNVGRYEREHYIEVHSDLREEERQRVLENKEREFIKLILSAYKAEPVDSFVTFVGKKRDRLIAVGPVNAPVSDVFIEEIIKECKEKGITKADVLGFDWEMGLDFSEMQSKGIDLQFKVIPREVFDKRAVEKGQVKFYDVAYIEIKPIVKKGSVAIELSDFSVFYNQDDTGEVEEKLKSGGSRVVIENGQVIKISKDKKTDIVEREVLTKNWTDWIDYWAVDFDFESKKEVVRFTNSETGEEKEEWTGHYVFENEWQSFRTKKDRKLEFVSASKDMPKGKHKIAVKVVDIFGNDTTKVIEINV
ncbi:MAG: site-specific DNA-methyltransferase [bacterium]|nr:site-specific DNA-methyltransferase [bacterium]